MTKKILFVGCSLTANSGFNEENLKSNHWPFLLSEHYKFYFLNIAVGGMSNEEIFFRTVEQLNQTKFDLIIVMWSGVDRKWVYHSESNVDDYTIINQGICKGYKSKSKELHEYAKLHYSNFNNQYVNIKKWLLMIKSLEMLCKKLSQPYIFISGFNNHLREINKIYYKNGFINLTEFTKSMLDFNSRPDYYILEKINVLKTAISVIDSSNWIDFLDYAFYEEPVDFADDQAHPGKKSNQQLVEKLILHIDTQQLL